MTAQPSTRQHSSSPETFVIAKLGDGFRVYSPDYPKQIYLVSGSLESPQCTCPEFRARTDEPEASCDHIEAVFGNGTQSQPLPLSRADGNPHATPVPPTGIDRVSGVEMVLKRSVSPDGRIDSLSIELSCDIAPLSEAEVRERAARMIGLQQSIADGFSQNGNHPKQSRPVTANGTVPAQLVSVGGMDGKWGRRLFLIVQIQDKLLKYFGSEKQLMEALGHAGFAGVGQVFEGMVLNLPCQVTTKPSPDGRYQNIEQILPATAIQR